MPRPSPLTESILSKSTVGRSVGADIYNAQPGQKVGHVTILSNSGAKLPGKAGKKQAASAPPWGRVVGGGEGIVVLAFSLPVRLLSPNVESPGKWRPIAAAKKAHRAAAAAAVAGLVPEPWERATMRAAFYWPDAKRRDPGNADASLKSTIDGIVEGGLLIDDDTRHLSHLPSEFSVDRACPRVELTLERIEA